VNGLAAGTLDDRSPFHSHIGSAEPAATGPRRQSRLFAALKGPVNENVMFSALTVAEFFKYPNGIALAYAGKPLAPTHLRERAHVRGSNGR
jgi:hypothetical protein